MDLGTRFIYGLAALIALGTIVATILGY